MYGLLTDLSSANGHTFEICLSVLEILCVEPMAQRNSEAEKLWWPLIRLSAAVMGAGPLKVEGWIYHQDSQSTVISPDDIFLKATKDFTSQLEVTQGGKKPKTPQRKGNLRAPNANLAFFIIMTIKSLNR